MEHQTTTTEPTTADGNTESRTREAGSWLIYAKDANGTPVLAERKTKKEAQEVVAAVGADNVLALYKCAKSVELKTKVSVHF